MSWRYNISVVTFWVRRWIIYQLCRIIGHRTEYMMYVPEDHWWLECRRCQRGHFRGDERSRMYW